ncbi:MAG: hypothetical protein IJD27_06270, partial [Alistipes sp.]|nr:hypothetical protein [Alistipes sp.]
GNAFIGRCINDLVGGISGIALTCSRKCCPCAFISATVPLLIVGIYARLRYKMDFFTIMGMLSGSMTNPIALNYANSLAGSDMPAISYATVYPLAMFLRVVIAQSMILMLM